MSRRKESPRFSRRRSAKLVLGVLLAGVVICVLGLIYATVVEPRWIAVTNLDVLLAGLPAALDGFTITQLSDLHLGPHVRVADVRRSVEIANALGADLIVLTGDFVSGSADYITAYIQELALLRAKHGVYAVLGNHDVWTDADQVAKSLTEAGIVVLRNQRQAVEVSDTCLWLLGIEDPGYTCDFFGGSFDEFRAMWQEARDALATLLAGIPADEPRLLLVHNPDFTEMLPDGRIDLALSGHTHGGQVCLPLLGALVVPSCFGQKYASGLVQGPYTLVYVNRGIGTSGLPMRFNCRPEITLLRLRTPHPDPLPVGEGNKNIPVGEGNKNIPVGERND